MEFRGFLGTTEAQPWLAWMLEAAPVAVAAASRHFPLGKVPTRASSGLKPTWSAARGPGAAREGVGGREAECLHTMPVPAVVQNFDGPGPGPL